MMKLEAKTGDIIRISGAYSKNDNGLFVVIHSFGDADWNGCEGEYWIEKLKKNGEISTAKYIGTFYPLHSYSNNREYVRKSSEWNEQNVVVEVVEGVNTSYIIDYFKNKADQAKKQKEYYNIRGYEWETWCKQYADSEAFYNSVIERLSAPQEKTETEQEEPKQEETEQTTEFAVDRVYYTINEETARIAKNINSFSDYVAGSATNTYIAYCDEVYNIVEKIAEKKPQRAQEAQNKALYYSKKLSQYFNDYYKNEASCPSVMICGPANFPTRKKERQNSRRDTLNNTWEYLQSYKKKIENILTCEQPIKAGDADATEQIREKITKLEEAKEQMKAINAYYRKHGTIDGFEGITEKQRQHIDFVTKNDWAKFGLFDTTNINAEIRRLKARLEKLESVKDAGTKEESNDLFTVIENVEIMRLQLLFDGIPDESIRDILKRHGFRWSPKNKAWQRQLTDNARYSLKQVKEQLNIA